MVASKGNRASYAQKVFLFRQYQKDNDVIIKDADVMASTLAWYAEGSSCCVYRIVDGPHSGKFLKEYYPTIADMNEQPRRYFLKGEECYPGEIIEIRSEADKCRFYSSDDLSRAVQGQYNSSNKNIFETSELWETSLGLCYLCSDLRGILASEMMREISQERDFLARLKNALYLTYFLLNDISEYHRSGLAHLDISKNNIFCVSIYQESESGYLCRSIDIGSCRKVCELAKSISEYANEGKSDIAMSMELFPSTASNYPPNEIQRLITYCKKPDVSQENKEREILFLDVKASMLMFVEAVFPNDSSIGHAGVLTKFIRGFNENISEDSLLWGMDVFLHLQTLLQTVFLRESLDGNPLKIDDCRKAIMDLITRLDKKAFLYDFSFVDDAKRIVHEVQTIRTCSYLDNERVVKEIFGNSDHSFETLLKYYKQKKFGKMSELIGYLFQEFVV